MADQDGDPDVLVECDACDNPDSPFCAIDGRPHRNGDRPDSGKDEPPCKICRAPENTPCDSDCEDGEQRGSRIAEVGRPQPPSKQRRIATAAELAAAGAAGAEAAAGAAIRVNPDLQASPQEILKLEDPKRITALPVNKIIRLPALHRTWIWGRPQKEERCRAYATLVGALEQIARIEDPNRAATSGGKGGDSGHKYLPLAYQRSIKDLLTIYKFALDPDPDLSAQAMQARIQAIVERVALPILAVPTARKKPMDVISAAIDHYWADGEADRLWNTCLARAEKDHSTASPGRGGGGGRFRGNGGNGGGRGSGKGGKGGGNK